MGGGFAGAIGGALLSRQGLGRLLRLWRLPWGNCRSPLRGEGGEARCRVSQSSRGMGVDPSLEVVAGGMKEVDPVGVRSLRIDDLVEVLEVLCIRVLTKRPGLAGDQEEAGISLLMAVENVDSKDCLIVDCADLFRKMAFRRLSTCL